MVDVETTIDNLIERVNEQSEIINLQTEAIKKLADVVETLNQKVYQLALKCADK